MHHDDVRSVSVILLMMLLLIVPNYSLAGDTPDAKVISNNNVPTIRPQLAHQFQNIPKQERTPITNGAGVAVRAGSTARQALEHVCSELSAFLSPSFEGSESASASTPASVRNNFGTCAPSVMSRRLKKIMKTCSIMQYCNKPIMTYQPPQITIPTNNNNNMVKQIFQQQQQQQQQPQSNFISPPRGMQYMMFRRFFIPSQMAYPQSMVRPLEVFRQIASNIGPNSGRPGRPGPRPREYSSAPVVPEMMFYPNMAANGPSYKSTTYRKVATSLDPKVASTTASPKGSEGDSSD